MNLVLGEVEETITSVEIDEETFEEIIKVQTTRRLLASFLDLQLGFRQIDGRSLCYLFVAMESSLFHQLPEPHDNNEPF